MEIKTQNETDETITELKAKIERLEARAASAVDWLKTADPRFGTERASRALGVGLAILTADTEGDGTRPDPRSRALHDAWLVSKATVAMREIAAGGDAMAIAKKFLLLLDNDSEGV